MPTIFLRLISAQWFQTPHTEWIIRTKHNFYILPKKQVHQGQTCLPCFPYKAHRQLIALFLNIKLTASDVTQFRKKHQCIRISDITPISPIMGMSEEFETWMRQPAIVCKFRSHAIKHKLHVLRILQWTQINFFKHVYTSKFQWWSNQFVKLPCLTTSSGL